MQCRIHLRVTLVQETTRKLDIEFLLSERKMQEDHGMARMQEILSSYYGMQDKESPEESKRNIDSRGFESKVYLKVSSFGVFKMIRSM
jgi:hypothetical protein